jgi:hypothetical protein
MGLTAVKAGEKAEKEELMELTSFSLYGGTLATRMNEGGRAKKKIRNTKFHFY